MIISGRSALVTGANRGLGAAIVDVLLTRGAAVVHAGARRAFEHPDSRVVPLLLDVTDPTSVADAVRRVGAVDLLVNNAGITGAGSLLTGDPALARAVMETNFWGPVALVRAFAPVLARHDGGAVVNVLSVLSWRAGAGTGAYSASKAAGWAFGTAARAELRGQGTQVLTVHIGPMDTGMMAATDVAKIAPADVARQIADAVEAGADELLTDAVTREAKLALAGEPRHLEL